MKWPRLPRIVHGLGGPIRIVRQRRIVEGGDECWGLWNRERRTVSILRSIPHEHQWRTLFHELSHAAITDSGVEEFLEDKVHEALCYAIASARIQEMRGELGI